MDVEDELAGHLELNRGAGQVLDRSVPLLVGVFAWDCDSPHGIVSILPRLIANYVP